MNPNRLVSEGNARRDYGDLTNLVQSICFRGVVVPVTYYTVGDRTVLWDGHRRVRAVQIINHVQGVKGSRARYKALQEARLLDNATIEMTSLGKIEHGPIDDIPAIEAPPPIDSTEALRYQLLSAAEGLREPLNPMDEAHALAQLVLESGVAEVAQDIGKSESYVSRRSRLVDLHRDFQEAVADGRLSPRAAEALLTAPPLDSEAREALIAAKTYRKITDRVAAMTASGEAETDVTPVGDDPLIEAYRHERDTLIEQVVSGLVRLRELSEEVGIDTAALEQAWWVGRGEQ